MFPSHLSLGTKNRLTPTFCWEDTTYLLKKSEVQRAAHRNGCELVGIVLSELLLR